MKLSARKEIKMTTSCGDEIIFPSIKEASMTIKIRRSTIKKSILSGKPVSRGEHTGCHFSFTDPKRFIALRNLRAKQARLKAEKEKKLRLYQLYLEFQAEQDQYEVSEIVPVADDFEDTLDRLFV